MLSQCLTWSRVVSGGRNDLAAIMDLFVLRDTTVHYN